MDQGIKLFYKRGKGRVTKSLSVHQFKNCLLLHFLTLDRTELTREQKNEGLKEQRIKTLDYHFLFKDIMEIEKNIRLLPHKHLIEEFFEEYKKNGTI